MRNDISNAYFEWLSDIVCGDRFSDKVSYGELLAFLHSKPFRYLLPMDDNRADDGLSMRYRFECATGNDERYLDGPCSVLEMMVALAIRCEETMDDPLLGDRTGQWFWGMVRNLGLGGMYGNHFDIQIADDIIERFLDREYEPDGRGGLFTISDCDCDLRDVEIWHQLWWYLDTITDCTLD